MQKKAISVLGISPSLRTMGVAIFRNNELAEWKTLNFKNGVELDKLDRIIAALEKVIDEYDIAKVAMKYHNPASKTKQLNLLVLQIQEMLKRNRIKLQIYSLPKLKAGFTSNLITKTELFELVRNKFYIFPKESDSQKQKRNMYYGNMYEAIACGKILADKIELIN